MTDTGELLAIPDTSSSTTTTRVRPSPVTASRGPKRDRRRRNQLGVAMLTLVTCIGVAAAIIRARSEPQEVVEIRPIMFEPTVVFATLRLDGALVRGVESGWAVHRDTPPRYGDPVPVSLTAYCLKGLTRRDRYVREGIVAADPRVFPLGRYLELYAGRTYLGRFLIDDTGGVIKGNKLDVWTPTCREARIFGRQQGTAVLVPRPRGARSDVVLTGRLAGVAQ